MNKITRYVVTAVDCGDSCDGHPSCLGVFSTEDDAKNYVRNDMEDRCDQLAGCDIKADFDRMEILDTCDQPICQWSVDEAEVDVDPELEKEVLDLCNEAYEKGYNEGVATAEEEVCIS